MQQRDLIEGYWKGSGHAEDDPNISTGLALLFLSKGRWPVLMAKAQFGKPTGARVRDADIHWNRHRNDVKNLTIYTEGKWKMELTWQTINVGKATVDDLLQVPVMFFSGGDSPLPDNEEARRRLAQNLRDYIDRGGFIFADADPCSDKPGEFDRGFRELMDLVFEKPEYRFKPLDASHPIWVADQKIEPDQARLLLGIDYGCRTCVVYAPVDPDHPRPSLACLWELARGGLKEAYSKAVKDQIAGGLAIGINVLAYATNRELKSKDEIAEKIVTPERPDPIERGKLVIAKLKHPGGCDAAPRALANLMEQAAHDLNIRVETHPKMIGMTDPALFDYPVVFMHGRNAFRLTDKERDSLRKYVERGGLLFADAICGSESFGDSFRREMAAIFPKNPLDQHTRPRSDLDDEVRRLRSIGGDPPRPTADRSRRGPYLDAPPRGAGAEGRPFRRPLRGDLLGVRPELRPGEARFDGVPRLHPRRRRPDRAERDPLRDAAVSTGESSSGILTLIGVRAKIRDRQIRGECHGNDHILSSPRLGAATPAAVFACGL